MHSLFRQMWQHGLVLALGISLAGCGSKPANNTVQAVPAANTGAAPGIAAQHGAVAPAPGAMQSGAMPANAIASTNPGGSSPDQMAKMMGQPHAMPGGNQPGANPGSMTPDQMAKMAGQQHAMPGGGQPSANPGGPSPEQMAKMMGKPNAMSSSNPNNPGLSNAQMAEMAKQQQSMQGGAGAAPNPNAQANAAGGANMDPRLSGGRSGAQSRRAAAAGGDQAPTFPPGSADEAIYNFCVAMADDDTACADEYVSSKAKGLLAELHEGSLSEEKIEEIMNVLTPLTELTPNAEQTSSTKRSLRNGKGQSISFTLKKEKEAYHITEFSYSKPKKKNSSGQ